MKICYLIAYVVLMTLGVGGAQGCSSPPFVTSPPTTSAMLTSESPNPPQIQLLLKYTVIPSTDTRPLTTPATLYPPTLTSTRNATSAPPTHTPLAPTVEKRLDPEFGQKPHPNFPIDRVIGIFVTDAINGAQIRIFGLESASVLFFYGIRSATSAPDGKHVLLAFRVRDQQNRSTSHLRILNDDGSDGVDIFISGDLGDVSHAVWSPDGKRIAFWAHIAEEGQACAFIINVDGTGRRRLDLCEYQDYPRYWSVDGRSAIVFFAGQRRGPGAGYFALQVDGTRRGALSQFQQIKLYDERYFPWRIMETPCVIQSPAAPAFWYCE